MSTIYFSYYTLTMIPETVHSALPLLSRLGVNRIGIFGSVARGKARPESDLDVLVCFEPGRKCFDSFFGAAEILETATGRQVDLVTLDSLSPYIGPHILEEVEYVDIKC